jgi:predicted transcriptional regulator
MQRDALISIRPTFADAILSGSKTVELRKRIPSITAGMRLWIYSTKPVGALVGTADVEAIERGSPDDIWATHHAKAGVCRAQYDAYYGEATVAYGITLANVQNGRPVDIDILRTIRPRFHPPQVMSFITLEEAALLREHLFGGALGED